MSENTNQPNLAPPSGGPEQAQRYLEKLIKLINQEKIIVAHTDLSKIDPSSLQDHYYITLNDYHIEISHNKKADTGEDFYILLFNNLKQIRDGCSEKVILAFMNLTEGQFEEFKETAKVQMDTIKAREDARRFADAVAPIDQVLENLENFDPSLETSVPENNVSDIPKPIDFAEAPTPEKMPEIPIFNEPTTQSVVQPIPQNPIPTTPII